MEYNKEEAIRAKGIAENKMKNNDFAGARKIALKAQQLYKDLENISQMIMVCDVHCSAEKKMLGNEMDWYGILQVEKSADEASIRKQFRKYALLLHPDKNKFPGAETAFKLIGEAHRVLSDKGKRSLHDIRRQHATASAAAPSSHKQQRPQSTQTFWTMCPFCNVRYQFYRATLNATISCQTCCKPFVAYERAAQAVPTSTNFPQPTFNQKKDVPSMGAFKAEKIFKENVTGDNSKSASPQKAGCGSHPTKVKMNQKKGRKQALESSGSSDSFGSSSDSDVDMEINDNGEFQAGSGQNVGDQTPRRSSRRKQHVSYQENLSDDEDYIFSHPKRAKASGSSGFTQNENDTSNGHVCDSDDDRSLAAALKANQKEAKQQRSASNEQTSDSDDELSLADAVLKAKQKEAQQQRSAGFEESLSDMKKATEKVSTEQTVNNARTEDDAKVHADYSTSEYKGFEAPDPYTYEDPDFNDFEKDRKKESFAAGQIWAIFDSVDAMPRYYARIRKVFVSEFKLGITWLEPDPVNDNEMEWVKAELPVSCGKFSNGDTDNTTDRAMFSHLVSWGKGDKKGTYCIFPRKGQTWGLFKDWSFDWKSNPDSSRKFEYEFVEILSDYVEGVGVSVAWLAKVKGFACVFCRRKEITDSFVIPPIDLFRFSHMVLSVKLTGEERNDVPKDSFELDPASLPPNLEEIDVPVFSKVETIGIDLNGSCLGSADKAKPSTGTEGCIPQHQNGVENGVEGSCHRTEINISSDDDNSDLCPPSIPDIEIPIPEPEFYNFDADKSLDKFQVGQIWSLYSDEDGLPKYYGEIVKIKSGSVLKVHVKWLVSCILPKGVILWKDQSMPICCGRFKITKDQMEYTSTGAFSHQVKAEPTSKKNEYNIFPSKGEIWALYQNWNAEIRSSELENWEYDVVEIIGCTEMHIQVLFLERMAGLNSVFKPRTEGSSNFTVEIPSEELLRFSHQVPAYRLSEERGGTLRGFWEVDSAALPVHYFLN